MLDTAKNHNTIWLKPAKNIHMTNKKPLTPNQIAEFANLPLREIEALAEKFRNDESPEAHQSFRAARQALSTRQRQLKADVMAFEKSNTHHLLFYDSTAGFVKMAGNSVLFFAASISKRLHWRFSIKLDTDHYSPSEDGVISIRSFEHLSTQLAEIDILPDPELNRPDLHFYKLGKIWTEEQIADLRDQISQESERIAALVMPSSPMPVLYDAIIKSAHLIYYRFKHLPDSFARETVGTEIVLKSHHLVTAYLAYANTPKSRSLPILAQIIELARDLRHSMAYLSRLGILHHRDIYKILDQLTTVERLSSQAYKRNAKAQTNSAHA